MKIMVVSSGIPTEKYPLLGIFELDQAKALAQEGNEVVFLGVDLRSIRRWRRWGISRGNKDGVDYYLFNLPAGRLHLKLLCKIGQYCLSRLYKKVELDFGKPDIIHAHFTEMGCIVSRLSKKECVPYVITEHSSKINQYNISNELVSCAKEAYQNANSVIAVGTTLSRNIFRHTGIKSIVVPNIINTELFFKCTRQQHDKFHLVTTSNLISLKRTWQIIQALAMINPSEIDYKLTIIGDGPERESILYWSKALGLENRVDMVGYQPREAIASIYENADVFILVSSSETFGVAYVEAMAAGLPVIATRCGGPEDFVNENNGLLVDVDNITQISSAIVKIYSSINRYKVENLRAFVKDRFAPKIIAERLYGIYQSIVKI